MNTYLKLINFSLVSVLAFSIVACTTSKMRVSQQDKPGFTNTLDIPLPESAKVDMSKSVIVDSGSSWSGHLVYDTKKPQPHTIDFITTHMEKDGWRKLSELRGNETVIVFSKGKRLATVRVINENNYISSKTVVITDMAKSNLKNVEASI